MKRGTLVGLSLLFIPSALIALSEQADAAQTMHRMYNPNSGEHFYTANGAERDMLTSVGWKYEGTGWTAPDSGANVYRMYNANAGDHHYTMNPAEKDMLVKVGWNYEGVGWKTDDYNGVSLHRLYNPNAQAGSHHYTTNAGERDSLASIGWKKEGIGWYGMNPNQKFNVKVVHKGSDGKSLNQETVSVKRDANYTAKSKSFNGYKLKGNSSQTIKADSNNKTITFTYTKNSTPKPTPTPKPEPVQKFTVTVKHVGSDGKSLKVSTETIEKGKTYTAKSEIFDGYTLNGSSSQTVTVNKDQTITFNYTKNTVAPVQKFSITVLHKDTEGNELKTEKPVEKEKDTQFTAEAESFDGYILQGEKTQTITVKNDATIIFIYEKVTVVDKTELKKVYDDMKENIDPSDYTQESATVFEKIMNKIKLDVLDKDDVTQEEVNNAFNSLNDTKSTMVYTRHLRNRVNELKKLEKGDYTNSTWNNFKRELDVASALLDIPNATQSDINSEMYSLNSAYRALKTSPNANTDKSDLKQVIDESKDRDLSIYTVSSSSAYEGALNNAKAVYDYEESSQKDIDEAISNLVRAIHGLVDKSALEELYNNVKDKDLQYYEPIFVKLFNERLDETKLLLDLIYEGASVEQREIDTLKVNLESAYNNLWIQRSMIHVICINEDGQLIGQTDAFADSGTYFDAKALDLTFMGYKLDDVPVKRVFVEGNMEVTFKYKKTSVEEELVGLQNRVNTIALDQWSYYRETEGVNPATKNETLQAMAELRAKEIAENYSHIRPNGYDIHGKNPENLELGGTLSDEFGYTVVENQETKRNLVQENIFQIHGVTSEWIINVVPADAVNEWKLSPIYNENLLMDINQVAVGSYVKVRDDGYYDVYIVGLTGNDNRI